MSAFFTRPIMHGYGTGNASARGRQGSWQRPPLHSTPVLPSRGGSSAVLRTLLVGACMTPSRFCEQPVLRQNWILFELGPMGPFLTSKLDRGGPILTSASKVTTRV